MGLFDGAIVYFPAEKNLSHVAFFLEELNHTALFAESGGFSHRQDARPAQTQQGVCQGFGAYIPDKKEVATGTL